MARDVEINVTASDRTGNALASVERRFKKTAESTKRESDKMGSKIGQGLVSIIEDFSPKLASSITGAVASAGGASGPLLVGGIAVAAPLIGATISAAITAGVSVGVAGIGVALVAQDARVKAAGQQLGKNLMSSLQQDASPFIGPVLKAIDTIQAKFDALRPVIQNIFRNASTFIGPLVAGVSRGVEGIVRGIDSLVAKSKPVVDVLSAAIGDIGESVGDFLAGIDTDGAVAGLKDLAGAIIFLIDTTGPLISALSKTYEIADKLGLTSLLGMASSLVSTGNAAGETAGQTDNLAFSFQKAADNTGDLDQALKDAEAAVRGMQEANRSLYDSTTSVGEAMANAQSAIKSNGKTLDSNTAKGRANRTALSNLASALNRQYEATLKVNGEGAATDAAARNNRASFINLASSMGLSKRAAQDLATKLGLIPSRKKTTVEVATEQARAAAQALKEKLAGIKDRTVYVNVAVNQGRLNKVNAQLASKHAGLFDATSSFAFAGGVAGASRSGGANPVSVNNNLAVTVTPDLSGIRTSWTSDIRASERKQRYNAKVGKR